MNRQSIHQELFMRRASDLLEQVPAIYCGLMRYRLGKQRALTRVASPKTDIAIEGFQRCANSFAVQAFRSVNEASTKLRIATHLHSPANVYQAVRFNVPTMVLIRNPDECLVSWLALAMQLGKLPKESLTEQNQMRRMCYWTQRYTQFYQRLMPARTSFVTVDFDEVVTDFGACIDRLNARFQTSFNRFEHSAETEKAIFAKSKVHLSPSVDREQIKQQVSAYYFSAANSNNRKTAQAMYQAFKD